MSSLNLFNQIPSIAIFCHELKTGGDPFSSDYYWQSYQDLLFALRARGVNAYFATDNNSYKGFGLFETVYGNDTKTSLDRLTPHKNVQIDLVFDRGGFIGRDVATINPAMLMKIADNKIEVYKRFAELQPFSIICESEGEVDRAFNKMPGDIIVAKRPEGCGGKEVYIGSKQTVRAQLPAEYPILVQEFFDTSAGIPGVVSGVHDVRISICGGEPIGFYVRKAKEGAYHSNVSQGGTMVFYDIRKIPPEIAAAVRKIDALFAGSPRYYSADFMLTPKGWKLLELNPYLALLPVTDGPEARKTLAKLADYLVAAVHESSAASLNQLLHSPRRQIQKAVLHRRKIESPKRQSFSRTV